MAPVAQEHARMLVGRLRLMRLLKGFRGRPPGDVDALADAPSRLSHLAFDLRDYIAELDMDDLIITEGVGCVAVDALAVRTADSSNSNRDRDGSQPETTMMRCSSSAAFPGNCAGASRRGRRSRIGHLPHPHRAALRNAVVELRVYRYQPR